MGSGDTDIQESLYLPLNFAANLKLLFKNKLWYIQIMEYYLGLKEMNCQAINRHRGNLNAFTNKPI